MKRLNEYWQAVRGNVCAKCIDSDPQGNCRLTAEDECGLKLHFPKIVETILSVKSDTLDAYIEALRQNVCASCIHQSADGKCMYRTSVDCGLDRYFPIVVEAIEEARRNEH